MVWGHLPSEHNSSDGPSRWPGERARRRRARLPRAARHDGRDTGKYLQVFVKGFAGKTFTIEAAASTSVGSLKLQIRDATGVPPDQQLLVFAGKPLRD